MVSHSRGNPACPPNKVLKRLEHCRLFFKLTRSLTIEKKHSEGGFSWRDNANLQHVLSSACKENNSVFTQAVSQVERGKFQASISFAIARHFTQQHAN